MTYAAPSYTSDDTAPPVPQVRAFFIHSSINHTSSTQVEGWLHRVNEICEVFGRSPLAQRKNITFSVREFLAKLKGMNGDHASDQKLTVKIMREFKEKSMYTSLGYDAVIMKMPYAALVSELLDENNLKSAAAEHGDSAWDFLFAVDAAPRNGAAMDDLALRLGEEDFASRSVDEQRQLTLLFWAGCCMHKDLNAFKAGQEVTGSSC